MLSEILYPLQVSLYSGLFATVGVLMGHYTCNLIENHQRDWKPVAIWGATGAMIGAHYIIAKNRYQKRLF